MGARVIEFYFHILRDELLADGGHDRLVWFLEDALADARVSRVHAQTEQRKSLMYEGVE